MTPRRLKKLNYYQHPDTVTLRDGLAISALGKSPKVLVQRAPFIDWDAKPVTPDMRHL